MANDGKAGVRTSEFKLAIATVLATVALAAMKSAGAGVALVAVGHWWAAPVALAITSLGYSISRGLAKWGALPATPGSDSGGIPLKTPE